MPIKVRNIRELKGSPIPAVDIRIDRGSYLGNPFDMGKNEALRTPVCIAHRDYTERVLAGEDPVAVATEIAEARNLTLATTWKQPTHQQFMAAMQELEQKATAAGQQKQDLGIWCWCAKRQCHGDNYKAILERSQSQNLEAVVLGNGVKSQPAKSLPTTISDADLIGLLKGSQAKSEPTPITYIWSRYCPAGKEGYELSTKGDRRFSALNARLQDGRSIEEAYQLDVKGYRVQGDDWRLGKGKPPLSPMSLDELYGRYKDLWKQWAIENPTLMTDLAHKANGKVLTDLFASTPVSQARALAELLNEGYELGIKQADSRHPSPKPYNPLRGMQPLNANVARHMVKDVAMAEAATQFIGMAAAPDHVPSSTRNYLKAWGKLGLANTGHYAAEDKVMISGSGLWKRPEDSRTTGQIQQDVRSLFESHYRPLLDKAIAAGAQILVGDAEGTDQMVLGHMKARGYQLSFNPKGYYECSPQRVTAKAQEMVNQPVVAAVAYLSTNQRGIAPGINIFSGSRDMQGLGAALTNPTVLSKQKGTIKKDYPVTFRGAVYPDAETAYQALAQGKVDELLMGQIIAAKLMQYPHLLNAINQNGGAQWLEQCQHHTHAKTPTFQAWEGIGRNSIMVRCLIRGYEAALQLQAQLNQQQSKNKADLER
jgi:Domain of unknown function (DUF4326)